MPRRSRPGIFQPTMSALFRAIGLDRRICVYDPPAHPHGYAQCLHTKERDTENVILA